MKRRQFLDKLIRLSKQNNEETVFNHIPLMCNKQPSFIKRYKQLKIGECQLNLEQEREQTRKEIREDKYQRKVMIITKTKRQIICNTTESKNSCKIISGNYHPQRKSLDPRNIHNPYQQQEKQQSNQELVSKICLMETPHQSMRDQLNLNHNSIGIVEVKHTRACSAKPSRPISKQLNSNEEYKSNFKMPLSIGQTKRIHTYTQEAQNNQNTNNTQSFTPINYRKQLKLSGRQNYRSQTTTLNQHQTEVEKRNKMMQKKEINKIYAKPFNPPPKITAKSYLVYQCKRDASELMKGKILASANSKTMLEVASLTKIMTCILAIEIAQQNHIDSREQIIRIGKMEESTGGTTADLVKGEFYYLQDLLYGLMLPSGNDASVAIAIWAGKLLLQASDNKIQISEYLTDKSTEDNSPTLNSPYSPRKPTRIECYNRFLQQMNLKAKSLNMLKTKYANSHGLANINNKSTAFDIALLSQYSMRSQKFREIVSKKVYEGRAWVGNGQGKGKEETKTWSNTHKLLGREPYIGIKTGFTTAAGACLSSCIMVDNREFIVVVIGCLKHGYRFRQTEILRKWMYKHEGIKSKRLKTKQSNKEQIESNIDNAEESIDDFEQENQTED